MVPSCEAHNNVKSQDDGYAIGIVGLMSAVYAGQFDGSTLHPFARELQKRAHAGKRLRASLIESARPVQTAGGPAVAVTLEPDAVNNVVAAAAKALFYHEHNWNSRWPGSCLVRNPHMLMTDLRPLNSAQAIADMLASIEHKGNRGEKGWEPRGAHPSIFQYQLAEIAAGQPVVRMVFYGAFHFLVLGGD